MDFEMTFAKTKEDLLEIADMMGKVFASRSYFDFFSGRMDLQTKDPYYKPEFSRIIKVEGKIVSHVSIIEKHMQIGKAVIKVAGIGDVFTHPDFRKHSFTRMLMNNAIDYMAKNRFPLSMLYGIMNFYHKYGYIESVISPIFSLPLKQIINVDSSLQVRPYKEEDKKQCIKLYNKAFHGKNLSVVRVEQSWFRQPLPNTCFVVTDDSDKPKAYIVTSAPPQPPSQSFHIKEAVAFDKVSADALLKFLIERLKIIFQNEFEIHQRPDTFFVEYLKDFGGIQKFVYPYEGMGQGMLRIVLLKELFEDLKAEIESRIANSVKTIGDLQINFKTDIGEIILDIKDGKIEIAKKASKSAFSIETSQDALVRLILGYYGTQAFIRRIKAEKMPAKAIDALSIIFPEDIPYTSEIDYF